MFEVISGLDGLSDGLKRAGSLNAGARFFTCALQVNPYSYVIRHPKGGEGPAFASQEAYDAAMVEAAHAAGIEVVAITDHFRVDTSESLRAAFDAAGIVVFPGFEACSSEGVHLLCLYPPETALSRLQSHIGECRLRNPDEASPQSEHGCEEIMRLTSGRGGLAIAAHVTGSNGLLEHMTGGSRIGPWRSPHLVAAAIPGTVGDTPQRYREILRNVDPDYRRETHLALINAADVSSPEGFSERRSWCRIKMSAPTIDGLRQAFLATDTRICLSSEDIAADSLEIAAIAWDGGFLDGQAVRLNNGLNVLIGGRGAGKSLVIESIRHAMDCNAVGRSAQENHDALIGKVLGPSTKVSVVLRDAPPSAKWYVIERTGRERPVVRGSDGAVIPGLAPIALAEGLEVYGQHELSELTRDKKLLAGLLGRYVADRQEAAGERDRIARDLATSRENIATRVREIARLMDETSNLATLRHQRTKMDELGARTILAEKLAFEASYKSALARREALDGLKARALLLESDLRGLPAANPDPAENTAIADVAAAGGDRLAEVGSIIEAGISVVTTEIEGRDSERPAMVARQRPIESELKKIGVDPYAYQQVANDITSLKEKADRLEAKQTELIGVREEREALLDEWVAHHAGHMRSSMRAARTANRALQGRVRVTVHQTEDLSSLVDLLTEHVRGAGPKNAVDRIAERGDPSLRNFAKAIRDGSDALQRQFRLTDVAARNVSAAGEALSMEIEEVVLGPAAEVELNVGEDGVERWKAIDDLSAGQKATAILLLLLGGSVSPLVIDQPEDDLDNRFIADTIVTTMRLEKRHRQFIFSSHNANIPVLGDAEQIVTLRPGVESGREHSLIPEQETGSLDRSEVRQAVERLLEGGKAAFELRRAKYGY